MAEEKKQHVYDESKVKTLSSRSGRPGWQHAHFLRIDPNETLLQVIALFREREIVVSKLIELRLFNSALGVRGENCTTAASFARDCGDERTVASPSLERESCGSVRSRPKPSCLRHRQSRSL